MTGNLPVQLTRFIGREAELSEIDELISRHRLVTLTGVGGCGKTRLAGQLGARTGGRWPDGFWLVDLGSVTDPELVARLTAATLGVLIEPGGDQFRALAAQLGQRQLLLCLDTCEHLLDATARLADTVLRACPGVRVLATSLSRRLPVLFGAMSKREIPDEIVRAWLRPLARREIRHDLRKYPGDARRGRQDLLAATAALPEFTKPVLVAWAAEDRLMPPEHGRRLAKAFPDSTLIEIPDSYTLVPEDQPHILAARLRDFISGRLGLD